MKKKIVVRAGRRISCGVLRATPIIHVILSVREYIMYPRPTYIKVISVNSSNQGIRYVHYRVRVFLLCAPISCVSDSPFANVITLVIDLKGGCTVEKRAP